MIEINDKFKCCGCSACVQRCPKQCISLKEDDEGFLYPVVDKENCIDCGLCEKVCPELHVAEERVPLNVYAIKHKNEEIRMKSSSGGVFTLLAEQIIDEDGVVFGARFDDSWEVMHDYAETKEDLDAFRGSKYIQSRIGNTFQQAEHFLKQGRKVMFTGTPCQIAGLKKYLRKEYKNLLAVDFVCHGVPSPKVWRMYLKEISLGENITRVNFRSKKVGWKKYRMVVNGKGCLIDELFYENTFMQTFLRDFILRPSCHQCVCKAGRSGADITMGDFWGIEKILPEYDDDKGCGLILNYSNNGLDIYSTDWKEMTYNQALAGNPSIMDSVRIPINRNFYFHRLKRNNSMSLSWEEANSPMFLLRIYRKLYRTFNK